MDVGIRNLQVLRLGGVEIWITETMVNTWWIMAILILLSLIVRFKIRDFEEIPDGYQNVIEALVEYFDYFICSSIGSKFYYLGNWFFMVFAFIMMSNLISLFGLRAPTADWSMTFACAFASFIIVQLVGLKQRGAAYLKTFFEPNFLFFPLNVIGELSRPVSLSFRLFGNVLSGTIIIAIVYNVAPVILQLLLPAVLHVYFDIIIGIIQTYIFCVLSFSFIRSASGVDAAQQEAAD